MIDRDIDADELAGVLFSIGGPDEELVAAIVFEQSGSPDDAAHFGGADGTGPAEAVTDRAKAVLGQCTDAEKVLLETAITPVAASFLPPRKPVPIGRRQPDVRQVAALYHAEARRDR